MPAPLARTGECVSQKVHLHRYLKVCQAGRIVSVATIIAVTVNTEGMREVLEMTIGPSEAGPFRTEFLRSLTRRGLRGVKLMISDAHEGLKAATPKIPEPPPGTEGSTSLRRSAYEISRRRSEAESPSPQHTPLLT